MIAIGALSAALLVPLAGIVEATEGPVGPLIAVPNEKLSVAKPSADEVRACLHRNTITWPGAQVRPVSWVFSARRLFALLPSKAPAAEPLCTGEMKSSAGIAVNVPVAMSVPPILYSTESLSPVAPPQRHCSPV